MSDVSASSVYQTLLDEINRGNDLSLQLSQVTFGVPELVDESVTELTHPTRRNSRVKVMAGRPGNGYLEVMANYNRLSLNKLFALGVQIPLIPNGALVDYLPALNQQLKTTLTVGDLQDVVVEAGTVQLAAHPNSLYVVGQGQITVGDAVARTARIKLEMGQGTSELFILQPDGTRGLYTYDSLTPVTPELNDATVLSRKNAHAQMIIKLVDADGNPLPVQDQPTFELDVSAFSDVQILDGPTLIEAIKAYEDAGLPYPSWYAPGCWLVAFSLRENTPPDARATVSVPGQSDIAPVSFNWRMPTFKAEFSVTQMLQPAIKLPPASTPPTGKVFLSFPNYNKDWDAPEGTFYQSDAVVLPGSGITGGVLRVVDWCKNFNTPNSTLNCRLVIEGQVTECADVPEWVGLPVKASYATYYLNHACTLEKIPDLASAQFKPELEDLNVYVDGLTFPGSTWDIGLRHSFHFTDIQGLQLEFYPYENLPNNNGEVPV